MARPITWRTIAGPNFNNSALGQSIDAFRSAGAGFSDLTDSLFKTQDRVDQGYTNEAIRRSLATGEVDPSLNPRADSAAVYEALLGKRKADTEEDTARSDLRTAVVNRNNLRADTSYRKEQTEDLSYKNSPEYRALQERATKADISADEASTSYNTWRAKVEKDESDLGIRIRNERQDLENKLIGIRQGAYQEYLQENVAPGSSPTLAQEREARMYAESAAQDPAARQVLEQYRLEKGYLDESWDSSTWGEIDILNRTTQADLAGKRAEREEKLAEAGFNEQLARSRGDLSGSMVRNGKLLPLTEEMKAIEKMGTYNEALSKIESLTGANVSRLIGAKGTSEEKQLIEFARSKLPNASLLAGAIEPYIAKDGKFDTDGFRDLLSDVGQLTMFDSINKARREKGLPPIAEDQESGTQDSGSGATAADLGLTTRSVTTKPASAQLLTSYNDRIKQAEEFISQLGNDTGPGGTVPIGGGVTTLKKALARAQSDGKPTPGELPGLEKNLQILENLLRQYQEGAKRQAEYDAVSN